jgi:hypothetical protein
MLLAMMLTIPVVGLAQQGKETEAVRQADTSIKEVQVLDVLDQTATARIRASWGIDYMQLAKFDGTWKIINIVWQTPPPAGS